MTESSSMSALPLVQYWHDETVPDDVMEMVSTFRELNPGMKHHLYSRKEAECFIAERFTDREVAAFRSCAVPAMQADYFRYCALLALGGIYVDADLRCVRSLSEMLELADEALLVQWKPENIVNGFLLFKSPDHPLLRLVLDVVTSNIERRVSTRVIAVTGPWVWSMLSTVDRLGSFDAVNDACAEHGTKRFADSTREAIGVASRVSDAFRGVRMIHVNEAIRWIELPTSQLAYKRSGDHWTNWQKEGRTIFS